jgi:hypothetical protein
MYDRELVNDLIEQVEEAIRRIERRFEGIASATDFIANDEGLDRLDGIAMMLIAIGETSRKSTSSRTAICSPSTRKSSGLASRVRATSSRTIISASITRKFTPSAGAISAP